jgi:hypothetical protein
MIDSTVAAPQGFEPRYADPESAVLPLNEGATSAERASCSHWRGLGGGRAHCSQLVHHTEISLPRSNQRPITMLRRIDATRPSLITYLFPRLAPQNRPASLAASAPRRSAGKSARSCSDTARGAAIAAPPPLHRLPISRCRCAGLAPFVVPGVPPALLPAVPSATGKASRRHS